MTNDTPTTPARTPRRTPAAIAAIAVVAAGALGFGGYALTSAWFTSDATVSGSTVSTGSVAITAGTAVGSDPIAAAGLLPGESETTTITVSNTGTADVTYGIGEFTVTGDTALGAALDVAIAVDGGTAQTHTLAEWATGSYDGIALAASGTSSVAVTVLLPETAGNTAQDLSTEFTIDFTAIQQSGQPATTPTWNP